MKKDNTDFLKVYVNQASRSWQTATTNDEPEYLSAGEALEIGRVCTQDK